MFMFVKGVNLVDHKRAIGTATAVATSTRGPRVEHPRASTSYSCFTRGASASIRELLVLTYTNGESFYTIEDSSCVGPRTIHLARVKFYLLIVPIT
jgi:hypothetical protein